LKPRGTFSELDFTPVGDGIHYRLLKPLVWTAPDGTVTVVPAGFYSDLASLPDIARIGLLLTIAGYLLHWRWLLALGMIIVWFANWIGNKAKTDREGILHDWRFWLGGKNLWAFFRANNEIYTTMRLRNPWLLCALYWLNLMLFGWFAWWSDAKKKRMMAAGQLGFLS
jgi:hypothetical protein